MRRFGAPVRTDRTYVTRPGAYAVIRRGDDVLLTEQAAPDREWQLPGGGIDPGESALQALHRECLEETGWRVRPLRRLGAYQRYAYMPEYDLWARKVCHVYLCAPGPRLGAPSEPDHRPAWTPIKTALRVLATEGDRRYLALGAGYAPPR